MRKLLGIVLTLLLLGLSPAVASAHKSDDGLKLSFVRAPVAPDGTTKGAPLDFLVVFADADPAVDGVGIKKGGTITVKLDPAFDMSGDQGTSQGPPAIILQGWPQSPRVPFPYSTDITGNTVTLTLNSDWDVGAFGPGPKAVHLLLLGSRNPERAGKYRVDLSIRPDPASKKTLEGSGKITIISKVRASVNVVSLFSGLPPGPPPLFNPLYQEVSLGDAGVPVGMYLWNKGGAPALGVDIEMKGPRRGRLMQNGHKVGWIKIKAPKGASKQTLTSMTVAGDVPGPSVEAAAFGTNIPTGLLISQFTPDPEVPGHYHVIFKMKRGNKQVMHYTVVGAGGHDD